MSARFEANHDDETMPVMCPVLGITAERLLPWQLGDESMSPWDTLRATLHTRLRADQVVILPPLDAFETLAVIRGLPELPVPTIMLDTWYNKGTGGVMDPAAYDAFLVRLLQASSMASHTYLWGFPEILGRLMVQIPHPWTLTAWLTWYYKNSPSVVRGWRPSQMTCLHFSQTDAPLYPEHLLTPRQREKLQEGKLRYIMGQTSVIEGLIDESAPDVMEDALIIGFIKKGEQTGHPSQKPSSVYQRLIPMTTLPGELVVDPMAGSGTTGDACRVTGRVAILGDRSEDYTRMMESRFGVSRIDVPDEVWREIRPARS